MLSLDHVMFRGLPLAARASRLLPKPRRIRNPVKGRWTPASDQPDRSIDSLIPGVMAVEAVNSEPVSARSSMKQGVYSEICWVLGRPGALGPQYWRLYNALR